MAQRISPDDSTPPAAGGVGAVRVLTVALALGVFLLVAALAAIPFLANQPRPAPDVTLVTVGGGSPELSSLRGQPLLISFWSTSCGTCLSEMPAMIALHERYAPRGLRTFAVAMSHDRPEQVLQFARMRGLPFEIVLDETGELARRFNDTQLTPTKFLIDGSGNIVRVYAGFTDFADLQRRVEGVLGG
jgi:peroxiredoxin